MIVCRPREKPPSQADVNNSFGCFDVMPIIHDRVHYSDPKDSSGQATVMAGRQFKIPTSTTSDLPAFSSADDVEKPWGESKESQPRPWNQTKVTCRKH